ncbi:MAG TPA: hypothetical protein VGQ99_00170 [Tepidisphaeraceae bacterium]|nr:hypothetical protein [Tepidisphaeraceae bacterium]
MLHGKRVKVPQWIHSAKCAIHVEVDAVIPDEDPSEPCFEPKAVKFMDELQRLANEGRVDELAKHGEVYVRRAG